MNLDYSHVDVFSQSPFGGNSLPVFLDARGLSAQQMLRITQELRHFEAIFLEQTSRPDTFRARIFDLFDELPFAGHPIIGAAAVMHRRSGTYGAQNWLFQLPGTTVEITTEVTAGHYFGLLDQGEVFVIGFVKRRHAATARHALVPRCLGLLQQRAGFRDILL